MNSMLAAIIGPVGWKRLSKAGFSRFIDDDFRPEQLTEDPRVVGVEIADPPLKENIKSLKPGDSATLRDYMRLGDNILGITLSKAYPELIDMPVTVIDTAPPGVGPDDPVAKGGYFHGAHPRLELPPPGSEGYMEAIHEALGHAVSAIEGWPRGSSPTRAGSYEAYRNAPGERFARTMQERARMRHSKWADIETSRRAEEAAAKGLRTFKGPSTYKSQRAPVHEMLLISPDESFKDTYMKTRQASKGGDTPDRAIGDFGARSFTDSKMNGPAMTPDRAIGDFGARSFTDSKMNGPAIAPNRAIGDFGARSFTDSEMNGPAIAPNRAIGDFGARSFTDSEMNGPAITPNRAIGDFGARSFTDSEMNGPAITPNRAIGDFGARSLADSRRMGRADAKGGDSGSETAVSETPVSDAPVQRGGPRIVINPTTFHNKKDALCVAFNEGFRVIMEAMGFEPQSEPTDAQRKFFSDTAYADDEVQLRRTILARIATFDTSVKDPTDDQLAETGSFLDAILESPDWCKNDWERNAVSRLSEAVKASVGAEPVEPRPEPIEPREPEPLQSRAALGAGETEDEDKKPLPIGGGGPSEDGNADTSGNISSGANENPYRDMTIDQKLKRADELLKKYEGTDKYDAFKERVDAMKQKYGEVARVTPDAKWNYDGESQAVQKDLPAPQPVAAPEDNLVQPAATSEDHSAREQETVSTTPSTDQKSSLAPATETKVSGSTETALDATGLASSLVGGVASGVKTADTAGQAVLDKMSSLIGQTRAAGQRAATNAATSVMDAGMKGVTAMKDAADATWHKAVSMSDRAALLKAKGGTAGEVQAAKNIARNLGAKAAQQSTAAQSALTSLESKAAEAARPALSKAAGASRKLLHTGVKQARTVALKRGAAALGKAASAAQFAYAGTKSGVKGAMDFADTMRSTGATGSDVMNAVKDTFTTKKGWRNLGKGLIGSLRDVGSTMTGGWIDDGERIRGTMEDAKGGETSSSFDRKRKRRA